MKYSDKNIVKYVQYLYVENYKTLSRKVKDLNKLEMCDIHELKDSLL